MRTPQDSISATEIKNRFGDCLQTVLKKQKPLLIEKHGKPAAVLVDFEKWQRLTEDLLGEENVPWIQSLEKLHQKIAKRSLKIKEFSAVELIKKAREEGY